MRDGVLDIAEYLNQQFLQAGNIEFHQKIWKTNKQPANVHTSWPVPTCRHYRSTNSPEPVIHKTSNERFPKARCKLSKKKPKLSIPLGRILIRDVFSYTCIQSVKSRNTRRRCKICSKLTIKTSERRHWRLYYDIFIITSLLWRHWCHLVSLLLTLNIRHLFLVILLSTLNREILLSHFTIIIGCQKAMK